MCGIIGYVGTENASKTILEGLSKIEYRGYDSAGLTIRDDDNDFITKKTVGGTDELQEKIRKLPLAHIGIGHTRWATHGEPSELNAHPQQTDNFSVVHNGIIENYKEIADMLARDHKIKFASDTDTEVLGWLIEVSMQDATDVRSAITEALKQVRGTFGLGVLYKKDPDTLYVARRSSPITVAELEDGFMVASDIAALPKHTKHVVHLEDDQIAVIDRAEMHVYDLEHTHIDHKKEQLPVAESEPEKGGFAHFMLKEIHEQPNSVQETLRGRVDLEDNTAVLGGLDLTPAQAKRLTHLVSIGCGTAYHSSVLASYLLEEITDVPMDNLVASEFLYRKREHDPKKTLAVAVSQSGETADTMAAINKFKSLNVRTHGVVNVVGSNVSRITDGGTYLHCGPEIAVASTKAFTSQVVAQLLMGIKLNDLRGKPIRNNPAALRSLKAIPKEITKTIELSEESIKSLAGELSGFTKAMFLGRGSLYPIALEGALKFKEITYIPTEGHAAGEMKHGPLALVDEDMLVVYLVREGDLFEKSVSNLREIDARKGHTVVFTDSEELVQERDDAILLPKGDNLTSPLIFNVALQLLSYYVANDMGLSIDKPRNLAKSVTVE